MEKYNLTLFSSDTARFSDLIVKSDYLLAQIAESERVKLSINDWQFTQSYLRSYMALNELDSPEIH